MHSYTVGSPFILYTTAVAPVHISMTEGEREMWFNVTHTLFSVSSSIAVHPWHYRAFAFGIAQQQ